MTEEQIKKQVPPKEEQGMEELSEDDLKGVEGGSGGALVQLVPLGQMDSKLGDSDA